MRLSVRSSHLPALFLVACSLITALPAASLSAAPAPPPDQTRAASALAQALHASTRSVADRAHTTDALGNPAPLPDPLSVSRIQSAYRATDAVSGTLTVTFTVTNNQRPLITPHVPLASDGSGAGTASITDTAAAIAATDYSHDPNIIHDAILTDALTGSATFVSGDPTPDRRGAQSVWNLGDIAPLATVTATLSISVPASASAASTGFTNLDAGASAWGMAQGRPVTAHASPAVLAPDTVDGASSGDYLRRTVDADTTDRYMLMQAAQLGQDPLKEFAYVQSLGYESYKGALRGTRGTLWSAAGNSLDKSNLLVAMLRASGIPTRYRHGTLDKAHAQQLILSMFPTPTRTVGYVPPGTPTSDPANDATLLSETEDHWWVEAYLPGQGWQDLDPSFAAGAIGHSYVSDANVATDGTDRIAEVPDVQRSKVTMRVKVETYAPATFTESNLSYSYPLEHTFNSEELVGEPVTLQHLVHHEVVTGGVVAIDLHEWTYTPYLVVAGQVIQGTPFDELRSFFPFGTHLPTAEWLDFEVHDPNGHVYTDERTIMDNVGYAPRHVGGDINEAPPAEGTFVNENSSYSTLFAPSAVPASAIGADYPRLVQAIADGQKADAQLQTLSNSGQINDQLPTFRQAQQTIQDAARLSQQSRLLMFAALSDYSTHRLDADLLTRSYAASPRILMTSWEHDTNGNTDKVLLDLRRDDLRTVVSPAQAGQAIVSFNLARGLSETTAESTALGQGSAQEPVGVASVFTEARRQSIPLIIVTSSNLAPLAGLLISADAKARIMGELQHPQNLILVPSRPVLINGQPQTGWLIINAITGQVVDEMESGQHQSLVEYSFLLTNNLNQAPAAFIGFLHGFAAYTFVFLANVLTYAATEPDLKKLWQVSRQKTHDFINTDLKEKFKKFKDTTDIFLPEDAAKIVGDNVDAYLEGTGVSANFAVNFVLPANAKEAVNISNELGWTKDLPTSVTVISGAVAIKAGGLIQGADYADAVLGDAVDPPLSNQLVARAPGPPAVAPAHASGLVQAAATTAGTTLRGGLTVAGLQSEGGLRGRWAADAQDTSVFTGVTPLSGTLYAMDGTALGTGEIAVQPQGAFASATVTGSPVASTFDGVGSTALYAAGLDGIGGGSAWNNYADTLGATQPYTLDLQDVVATVNGTAAYTGSFTLTTSDTPSFTGSGHTAVPNFARTAGYTTTDGQLNLGPATGGDFSVGGASFDASNGVALSGYNGPITVTSVSPTSERVELDGNGSFFTLHASPANSTVVPSGPATFQARIDANSDDTYTTTVEAPPNWTVALDASGLVTATPPLGTAPGDYAVRVSAQSGAHPDLVASAVHTVTVTPAQGVALAVAPDPQFTVPWGPGDPNTAPGDTNDGRLQLTGAAFTIDVTNTSTVSHTFDLSESGLPDGWALLSNTDGQSSASLALPAGGVGQVGLYISPTVTMLPTPGTVEPFTVHVAATDDSNSALTGSASQSFTIPAIAFSQVTAAPAIVDSSPGLTTTFQLALRNAGNVRGTFPLSLTLPISDWTAALTSPLTLDPGQAITQTVTVQTPDGTLGQDYPVEIDSPSDGYTQSTSVLVHLTSPAARAVDNAAQTAGALFPDNLPLSAGLAYLGQTIETFQTSCQHAITMTLPSAAACSTDLRDHIVSAAQQVAAAVATTSPLLTDGDAISDTSRTIGATTTVSLVDDAIVTLQGQITALQDQLTDVAQHGWQIGFTPGRRVVLQGKPATFGLRLANTGSLTTTYALTLTTPSPSVALAPATTTVAVAPGASVTVPVTATTSTLGSAELQAEVAAVDAPDLASLRAPAGLTAVDALLRVTGVRAAPSFVEYGPGAAPPQVVAQVANVANEPISGTARVRLLDASGTDVYSSTQPLQLADALSPVDYPLNPITATGLTTGTYVLAVDILDADGQLIPRASGRGVLSVGQAVTAGSAVYPSVVAPGDVTATTSLTSALDLRAITPHTVARALAASRISARPPVVGATSLSGATAPQRAATTDVTRGITSHTYITSTALGIRPTGSRVLGVPAARRPTVATMTMASTKHAPRASGKPRVHAEAGPLPAAPSRSAFVSRSARAHVALTSTTNVPALYMGQSSAPHLAGLPSIAWPSSALAAIQPPFVPGYQAASTGAQRLSYHPYQATHTNSTPIRSRWVPAISGAAFVSPSDVQQTNVCGAITADTHWTLSGSPYVMTCPPEVSQGVTLTVDPGVVVQAQGGTGLDVQGKLNTLGTSAQPITFTSAAITPTAGDWDGVRYDGVGATGGLTYTTVAYGGCDSCVFYNGVHPDVRVDGASPTFDHLTAAHSGWVGLYVTSGQPVVRHGSFVDNASVAADLANDPDALAGFLDNHFSGNATSGNGVYLEGGTVAGPTSLSPTDVGQLRLAGTLSIATSGALTLTAGMDVLGGGGIDVQGALYALGSATQPISFTSASDIPSPGDWPGLTFEPGSIGYLNYAAFTYAGTAISANNAEVTIHNSLLTADTQGISNCAGCTSTPVHAENNYWGSPDGPAPTGHGPAVSSNVIIDPFETSSDLASTAFKPTYTLATSLDQPAQTTGVGGAATYNLGVRDTGNVPNTVAISLTGLDPSWYSVSPTRFSLIPGQTGQVTLAVAPPTGDCTLVGTHPFTLTATSGGDGATHDVRGSLTLTANPAITGLAPDDNATVGATDALFSWQTSVSGTSTLRIFPTANPSNVQVYTATGGLQHQVHVSGLVRNTDYSWSVHTASACGASDSAPRTLHIGNGLVFSQRSYDVYIQRDYNQLTTLQVTNQDDVSHTLLLTNTAPPAGDLIAGFIGLGSSDGGVTLQPGETRNVTFGLSAQDAQSPDYNLVAGLTTVDPGQAPINDAVPVHVHVHIPDIRFALQEVMSDTTALTHTFRITNQGGDPLTDLAVTSASTGTGTLYFVPGITHGHLDPGQSVDFIAYTEVGSDFQALTSTVMASAASVTHTLPVVDSLPPGTSMYLGDAPNTSMEVSNKDWYCTNRPIINDVLSLPSGFRRADMSSGQLRLGLYPTNVTGEPVRPHNLDAYVNDNRVGGFQNSIPDGVQTYPVQPGYLNEAAFGPTQNNVRLQTTHLNGGHYVVATDLSLSVCMSHYREWVAATSQDQANAIVASRSYLIPPAKTLGVQVLSPAAGTRVLAGQPVHVTARVTDDIGRAWSYIVVARVDGDSGILMLYDDGQHGDGDARDGVYGGTWVPTAANAGAHTLTVSTTTCTLSGSGSVSVTVDNPTYAVSIDHAVPLTGVTVLTPTLAPAPLSTIVDAAGTRLHWEGSLDQTTPVTTQTFETLLPRMQPGEVRDVAADTVISYTGEGGSGQLHLGPLSVAAAHFVSLTPPTATASPGGSARYTVTLSNPTASSLTLTPTVAGLPSGWAARMTPLTLAPGARVSVTLTVTVPPASSDPTATSLIGDHSFAVLVATGDGGQDQAGASLTVADALVLAVAPNVLLASDGDVVTTTATLTNSSTSDHDYALAVTGLAPGAVQLPSDVQVPAGASLSVPVTVTAQGGLGPHAFALTAWDGSTRATANAVLAVLGDRRVIATLSPSQAVGGPGVPVAYALAITNTAVSPIPTSSPYPCRTAGPIASRPTAIRSIASASLPLSSTRPASRLW